MPTRCTATTAKNRPCKAWAIAGTDPPRCASHGGTAKRPGAPTGNTNAQKHGFYATAIASDCDPVDLGRIIDDAARRYNALGDYFDNCLQEPDTSIDPHLLNMFSALNQTASRITRMLRDQRVISGDAADGLAGALARTMEEIGIVLDTDIVI